MKVVNLLLAVSDRRMGNSVEAAVRDVCYEQAVVECTRCFRVDELLRQGGAGWFDLIVVAPNSLLPSSSRRGAQVSAEQVAEIIGGLKSRRGVPVLAINVAAEGQLSLLEAGADAAFGFPFDTDALKREMRRVLQLSEPMLVQERSTEPSLVSRFLRGWQLLKNA